jgi:hypothetical protein
LALTICVRLELSQRRIRRPPLRAGSPAVIDRIDEERSLADTLLARRCGSPSTFENLEDNG